jgi:hypothetical protein
VERAAGGVDVAALAQELKRRSRSN